MTAYTIMFVPTTADLDIAIAVKALERRLTQKNIRALTLPRLDPTTIEELLAKNQQEAILEAIVKQREELTTKSDEIILVPGVPLTKPYAAELNFSLATALGTAIIFVANTEKNPGELLQQLQITANPYQYRYPKTILGFIVNSDNQDMIAAITKLDIQIPFLGGLNYEHNFAPIQNFLNAPAMQPITPAIFKLGLKEKARTANKTIVLPEGDEPRTIAAANICVSRGLAQCVLLETKEKIAATCKNFNLTLDERIKIIEPHHIVDQYVNPLYELRKAKGLSLDDARKQLEDHVMLGTMMLQAGEVDGLVSGAVHTTANTIRPALQIIKTPPHVKIVSSVFFMCLADQVLVFGDCAINPNPTAEELADIAIQSAASAAAFGIPPKIAMLSYSTGTSGFGPSVDKIRTATELVRKLRPELEIEGPIQYDAAISEETAKIKAPNSKVAGHATVFVMPNLDVGNIVYKAVQRGTGIVCIGPMLQGLRKPVNDLSRGCSTEDIVFTIAVTAIQAL